MSINPDDLAGGYAGLDELLGIDPNDPATRVSLDNSTADLDLIERLRQVRQELGVSRADLTVRMGSKLATVIDFERLGGDPHLSTIRRYADALGVRITHHVEVVHRPRHRA